MAEEKLFVYGHLMAGMRYHDSHMAGHYRSVVLAKVEGRLLYLPDADSPAMMPGDEGSQVQGEVYVIDDSIFKGIDYLFGCKQDKPEDSEFIRRRIEALTAKGETVTAWAYFLRAGVQRMRFPDAYEIESGDWPSFHAEQEKKRRQSESGKFPVM